MFSPRKCEILVSACKMDQYHSLYIKSTDEVFHSDEGMQWLTSDWLASSIGWRRHADLLSHSGRGTPPTLWRRDMEARPNCPRRHASAAYRSGKVPGRQRHRCGDCGFQFARTASRCRLTDEKNSRCHASCNGSVPVCADSRVFPRGPHRTG